MPDLPARTGGRDLARRRSGDARDYKSEALFAAGVDPRRRVATLDLDTLTAIYAAARTQMRANLGPEPRTTRQSLAGAPKDARYFVYSRSGKPCPRCQTTIACISQGDNPPRRGPALPRYSGFGVTTSVPVPAAVITDR